MKKLIKKYIFNIVISLMSCVLLIMLGKSLLGGIPEYGADLFWPIAVGFVCTVLLFVVCTLSVIANVLIIIVLLTIKEDFGAEISKKVIDKLNGE